MIQKKVLLNSVLRDEKGSLTSPVFILSENTFDEVNRNAEIIRGSCESLDKFLK